MLIMVLFGAGLPAPVGLEMMRGDPPSSFSETWMRAENKLSIPPLSKLYLSNRFVIRTSSQSTPSATTFMLQHEEILRQTTSSILSLQGGNKTRATSTKAAPNRHKPRPSSPRPQSESGKYAPDRELSVDPHESHKPVDANNDHSPQCK